MEKLPPTLTGVAGEYFVAAELTPLGFIASITLRNTRGIDIIASDANAQRQVGIQVKANRGNARAWILNKKSEDFVADNLFYVFVALDGPGKQPRYHIAPSSTVADFIKNHEEWLARPGRKGAAHKDNPMRKFMDPDDQYLARWDLLGLADSTR